MNVRECTREGEKTACDTYDEVSGLLDGGDLLGTFLIELEIELLLEGHHDLDGIEGVGSQVDKLGLGRDGIELGSELLGDDLTNIGKDLGLVLHVFETERSFA